MHAYVCTLPNARTRMARTCVHTNVHAPRSTSMCLCLNSFSQPLTHSVMARPAIINYNTPNVCVGARRMNYFYSMRHNVYDLMCWYVFECTHWIHFIPWLCCLCAQAPLWAWCGMGICLWAILITSRNGKCLMCSGEVIDIDLCCGGLWRGSIIAGSQQSQLCIIRLGCVFACMCVWVFVCEYCEISDSGPAWKRHT